jgi:hypothetical protein
MGPLQSLKWLQEHANFTVILDGWCLAFAAGGGHLQCVRWLREVAHCPLYAAACALAAKHDHLEASCWLCCSSCRRLLRQHPLKHLPLRRNAHQHESVCSARELCYW